MGTAAPPRIPNYRLHSPSGLAVVRLNGRDIYLGKYGTHESRSHYDAVIADWLAGRRGVALVRANPSDRSDTTISELPLAFLKHADRYYTKTGSQRARRTTCAMRSDR